MKLTVDTLHLERGARSVIANLSFAVGAGEALILTGANGAGKTTLLRALAGLLPPSDGKITLDGGASDATLAEQCHFIGHQNGLKSTLTASENLAFWGQYLDATPATPQTARIANALAHFNLTPLASIPAGYLSAGQKRRLGLARLLVTPRPVWLLDEPTVSLDAASVSLLASVINAHVAAGGIVIAATHLPLGLTSTRELRLSATTGTLA